MKVLLIEISIFLCFIYGCKKDKQECYRVINTLFVELMGTDDYYESYDSFCSRVDSSNANFENYIEKRKIDLNKKLYVLINDSLCGLNKSLLAEIEQKLNRDDINNHFFSENAHKLLASTPVELSQITNTGRYLIANILEEEKILKKCGDLNLFYTKISPIVFDENYKKGFFFFQLVKSGGVSGYMSFIFIKKEKGNWIIEKEINLGVF